LSLGVLRGRIDKTGKAGLAGSLVRAW
jgi:hypothetical protein